jgi:hypothetical protein
MITKIHFTGDRKIMNMQKVGTFVQSNLRLAAEAFTGKMSLKSMCHAIHYANNKNNHKRQNHLKFTRSAIIGSPPPFQYMFCTSSRDKQQIDAAKYCFAALAMTWQ